MRSRWNGWAGASSRRLRTGGWGPAAPYPGAIAIDGNLTEALLAEIGASPHFAAADLRLVPASPGKAERLRPLLGHPRATLYVNLEEAGLITGTALRHGADGAAALLSAGARRAVVTDGTRARRWMHGDEGAVSCDAARGGGAADHRRGRHLHGRPYRGGTGRAGASGGAEAAVGGGGALRGGR
jgi:hypothetical protein